MIDPVGRQRAQSVYGARTEQTGAAQRVDGDKKTGRAGGAPQADTGAFQVSEGLRQIQRATEAVRNSPDVRAERVAELRRQIEAGEYGVDPGDLAAKMLGLPGDDA